jgi:hypothetical protein
MHEHSRSLLGALMMMMMVVVVVNRYEDNGDAVNALTVIAVKADKSNIEGYG